MQDSRICRDRQSLYQAIILTWEDINFIDRYYA